MLKKLLCTISLLINPLRLGCHFRDNCNTQRLLDYNLHVPWAMNLRRVRYIQFYLKYSNLYKTYEIAIGTVIDTSIAVDTVG